MGYVDFKVTSWERVYVDDDNIDMVIDKIKSGEVSSSDDIYTEFEVGVAISSEILLETVESMTVEENDGQSTIEVYRNNEDVYTNAVE